MSILVNRRGEEGGGGGGGGEGFQICSKHFLIVPVQVLEFQIVAKWTSCSRQRTCDKWTRPSPSVSHIVSNQKNWIMERLGKESKAGAHSGML